MQLLSCLGFILYIFAFILIKTILLVRTEKRTLSSYSRVTITLRHSSVFFAKKWKQSPKMFPSIFLLNSNLGMILDLKFETLSIYNSRLYVRGTEEMSISNL